MYKELKRTIELARIVVEDMETGSSADRAEWSKTHLSHLIVAVQKNSRDRNRHDGNDNSEKSKRPSERAVGME